MLEVIRKKSPLIGGSVKHKEAIYHFATPAAIGKRVVREWCCKEYDSIIFKIM